MEVSLKDLLEGPTETPVEAPIEALIKALVESDSGTFPGDVEPSVRGL
jgi:hypothetical protein